MRARSVIDARSSRRSAHVTCCAGSRRSALLVRCSRSSRPDARTSEPRRHAMGGAWPRHSACVAERHPPTERVIVTRTDRRSNGAYVPGHGRHARRHPLRHAPRPAHEDQVTVLSARPVALGRDVVVRGATALVAWSELPAWPAGASATVRPAHPRTHPPRLSLAHRCRRDPLAAVVAGAAGVDDTLTAAGEHAPQMRARVCQVSRAGGRPRTARPQRGCRRR